MQPLKTYQSLGNLKASMSQDRPLWVVDLDGQRMWAEEGDSWKSAPVSTSRFGTGNEPGSQRTPTGLHVVTDVIGRGAAPGQAFESRKPSGPPLSTWTGGTGDAILTRILWLQGVEPGINDHSHDRYIYVHGTHQEERLGTPASHGCIRMANRTIAAWADALTEPLPYIWIGSLKTRPGDGP